MALSPPAIPLTVHVMPGDGVPEAVIAAVKTCALPAGTLADAGETLTTMSSFNAMLANALAVASALLAAVMVSVGLDGRIAGAV